MHPFDNVAIERFGNVNGNKLISTNPSWPYCLFVQTCRGVEEWNLCDKVLYGQAATFGRENTRDEIGANNPPLDKSRILRIDA